MTSTSGGWLLCHGSRAKPRGESDQIGRGGVSEKEEGRGGGWLGLIRMDSQDKSGPAEGLDVRAEAERGGNRGRGRGRRREAGGKNLSIAAVCPAPCLSSLCVFLRIIFFFLFVDPHLRLVYDMPR